MNNKNSIKTTGGTFNKDSIIGVTKEQWVESLMAQPHIFEGFNENSKRKNLSEIFKLLGGKETPTKLNIDEGIE